MMCCRFVVLTELCEVVRPMSFSAADALCARGRLTCALACRMPCLEQASVSSIMRWRGMQGLPMLRGMWLDGRVFLIQTAFLCNGLFAMHTLRHLQTVLLGW